MFGAGAAERRAEQLRGAGVGDGMVRAALEILAGVVADPGRARARAVALACRRLSAWAGERGRLATQFYFAAAAGLCAPHDARHAYQAGRLARDLAKWDAAETWLEFAVAAAKRGRDRETQTVAVLGLGNTFYRQGFYRRAEESQTAALALARKHGLTQLEAGALHNLFITAAETRDPDRAEERARLALHAYGPEHRNLPSLAHDVALFWLSSGQASRALPVLHALVPWMKTPVRRLHLLASLARAAGDCGSKEVFQRAWSDAWPLSERPEAAPAAAPALLQLAYGAASLGEARPADRAAAAALRIGRERGEQDVISAATGLLCSLAAGSLSPCEARQQSECTDDAFASELVLTLARA
jgi:tetratricopeptide (TPR) repeat protein